MKDYPKNQDKRESKLKKSAAVYRSIAYVVQELGESEMVIRANLDRFYNWGRSAIRYTPGGQLRFHVEAVEWVRLNSLKQPNSAREICRKIAAE